MDTIEIIMQTKSMLHNIAVTKWFTQDLLSIKWWGAIGFVIFSYILCFSLMDKTRLTKTVLFGSLISVFAVVVDIIGSNFNYWTHTVFILPMTPSIFLYDITALPMYYMLIYQHAYSWKSYAVWNIGASAIMGFVFSPLLAILGIIRFDNFSNFDNFLMISFIGFLAKAATSLIFSFEDQYQSTQQTSQSLARLHPVMKPLDEQRKKQGDTGDSQ
ncbi:hypothetical protein [Pelosinus propionicus]|uniref:Uncharacterized protein n=1 Tax=Pelosinus propionicus DSM 13327 TaxID=1123291 RepID=A0A1I4Q4F3_9FIRM|nr:hypothetical protein [Pelosinus propionicus]SFM34978.1 hypothetical protein SAMN04490355_108310 [Pelosinus propionicus DSM 13327]